MIKYVNIPIEKIKILAFDTTTQTDKALLLQDLLIRMIDIKKEEGLLDSNFVFLQNSQTGEIKMQIV